jgi:hypothetical protein
MQAIPTPFGRVPANVCAGIPPMAFGSDDHVVVISLPNGSAGRAPMIVDARGCGGFEPGDE